MAADDSDGIADVGKRRMAQIAVALGTVLTVLDGTIANVALPTIARELHVSNAASIWVVNGFQLAVTMTLFSSAALGDIVGYATLFRIGLAIFTIASLGCAFSTSLPMLVSFRVLQGLGASCVMAIAPALYRSIFPRAMLGRALAFSAVIVAASASAGPAIGGTILGVAQWPWLFAINVPIGIVASWWGWRNLPKTKPTRSLRTFDIPSAILGALAFGSFVYGVDGIARHEPALVVTFELALGIGSALFFIRRSTQQEHPLLPVELFRKPMFSLSAGTSTCTYIAQGLAYVALPFFFQSAMGVDPFHAGLLLTSWPIAVVFAAPLAGRLTEKFPNTLLATIGLVVLAIGLGMYAVIPAHPSVTDIVVRGIVCGLGFGFFQTPNNRELLSSAPREKSGTASGVLASMRLLGQTLGAALTAVCFSMVARALGGSFSGNEVHVATEVALWLACGSAALGATVSAFRLRGSPEAAPSAA